MSSAVRVRDLSEAEILARIFPILPVASSAVVPTGDDSAVFDVVGDTTISTDMLIQDRHFRTEWSTGFDVGFRAAQQNIADAVAMGARPVSLVVGLGMPGETSVDWVEDFARGLADACEPWGIGVDGGDLVSAQEICVSITVMGDLEGRPPLLRSGALPGHKVVFAGNLGHGIAGYELLQAGYDRSDSHPGIAGLIDDFLRPKPPVGIVLRRPVRGFLLSLMDVSDGLIRDLGRIAQASRVWIDLDPLVLNSLLGPIALAAGRLSADRRQWALSGGEDHGFIGTMDADTPLPAGFTQIGTVRGPDQHGRISLADRSLDINGFGWDHFRLP